MAGPLTFGSKPRIGRFRSPNLDIGAVRTRARGPRENLRQNKYLKLKDLFFEQITDGGQSRNEDHHYENHIHRGASWCDFFQDSGAN